MTEAVGIYVGGEWRQSISVRTYEKRSPWRPDVVTGVHAASRSSRCIGSSTSTKGCAPTRSRRALGGDLHRDLRAVQRFTTEAEAESARELPNGGRRRARAFRRRQGLWLGAARAGSGGDRVLDRARHRLPGRAGQLSRVSLRRWRSRPSRRASRVPAPPGPSCAPRGRRACTRRTPRSLPRSPAGRPGRP